MGHLLTRWLTKSILLMLMVSALTFVLVSLTPGDPARTVLGTTGTQEDYLALREQMGLNDPLLVRYGDWLWGAVRGDLGESIFSGQSVTSLLTSRLEVTLVLIIGGVALSALLGIALGVASATRSGPLARFVDLISLAGSAVPPFWLGLVLATMFSVQLKLVPVVGYVPFGESPGDWLKSVVLPITTLGLGGTAIIAKQTRDAMLDELGRDYVLMLRAHGTPEIVVYLKHALRNAAVPVVTVVGVLFINLLGGTVLVETVFSLPGLGGLAVNSTVSHDLPVIQGVTVLFALVVVTVNLVVDLSNALINPKVRS